MGEKPLHVRVAEALGCKPELRPGSTVLPLDRYPWSHRPSVWYCTCEERHEGPDASRVEIHTDSLPPELFCYDTDWSATGPLIERFCIGLDAPSFIGDEHWMARGGRDYKILGYGKTALEAACECVVNSEVYGGIEALIPRARGEKG